MSDLAGKPSNLSKAGVRIVKPYQFDSNTPQMPEMSRMAAISRELAGSEELWGGSHGCGERRNSQILTAEWL